MGITLSFLPDGFAEKRQPRNLAATRSQSITEPRRKSKRKFAADFR
jgi:hypothetical protein